MSLDGLQRAMDSQSLGKCWIPCKALFTGPHPISVPCSPEGSGIKHHSQQHLGAGTWFPANRTQGRAGRRTIQQQGSACYAHLVTQFGPEGFLVECQLQSCGGVCLPVQCKAQFGSIGQTAYGQSCWLPFMMATSHL